MVTASGPVDFRGKSLPGGGGRGSRYKGPGARGMSWDWSRLRKAAVCLMPGSKRRGAEEAMGKSLDAVVSMN